MYYGSPIGTVVIEPPPPVYYLPSLPLIGFENKFIAVLEDRAWPQNARAEVDRIDKTFLIHIWQRRKKKNYVKTVFRPLQALVGIIPFYRELST